jgi:hypothetical protein
VECFIEKGTRYLSFIYWTFLWNTLLERVLATSAFLLLLLPARLWFDVKIKDHLNIVYSFHRKSVHLPLMLCLYPLSCIVSQLHLEDIFHFFIENESARLDI